MPPYNEESEDSSDKDTGQFQFSQHLENEEATRPEDKLPDLSEQAQKRLIDLIRLEPTSNSELQEHWGLDSGSAVHQYLESNLKPHYYRDDDSYICVSEEAKDFVREDNGFYQDVTDQSENSEDVSQNIRNRDLLMDLVSVAQSLGHIPQEEDIEKHSEYSPQVFNAEFGDLFQACEEAGIVPESVTKSDYEQAIESQEKEEPEQEEDEQSKPSVDELVEELQLVDNEIDRIPYPSDMDKQGAFSANIYQEQFGSWNDALDAADIDKEEELLKDMETVAKEVGMDLTQSDMNEHGLYSSTMTARYFGSWSEAKEQFKQWTSWEEEEEEESEVEFDDMVNDRLDDILN
jgi:hypothetical protein